jgi:general secretion pathway protein J
MSPSPRPRGFTLIEVTVTLALMSLISVILIESLRMGGHTWRAVNREAANVDEISRAQAFLREHLGAIAVPRSAPGSTFPEYPFVGESNAIEFSGASPGYAAQSSARYRLELSPSLPSDVQIRYQQGRLTNAGWSIESLVAHAEGMNIEFWEEPRNAQGRWVTHWADPRTLPRLIRIDVRFADNDGRRWPPLYVQPRVDTASNCVFDVVSRRCRAGT